MRLRVWMGWCVFGLWLGLASRAAGPLDPALDETAKLFALGRHAEAASLLDRMTRTNGGSADLWFNLGQARAHCGEVGRAVSAWRRGLRIAPRDAAMRAALESARTRTGSAGDHPLAVWTGWLRAEEWALLALGGTGFLSGIVILRRWMRPGPGPGWMTTAVMFQLLMALGWGLSWMGREWSPDAVVVVKEAPVVQAPVVQAKAMRTLAEGSEVRILRGFGDWVEVGLDGGRVGWLQRSAVAPD